ncbi:MAG: cyclic pyranopterin monophosphate synthase MoaC [Halobacteriota archaeon]
MDLSTTHRHGMVDISGKEDVVRIAVASGKIKLKSSTVEQIKAGTITKGDVLGCAETAAILAVKKTPDVIPLCHYILIDAINVDFSIGEDEIKAAVSVKSAGKTGVEMDALCGVSVALLTIWDMVKSAEKDDTGNYPHTSIEAIRVDKKDKSG